MCDSTGATPIVFSNFTKKEPCEKL